MAPTGDAGVRCTFCGGRGAPVVVDLRGIRYDYCDAACATAHRQAVELVAVLCPDCDENSLGDTGSCAEHLEPAAAAPAAAPAWRRAG
jgi:hypothetical protein